MTNRLRLGTRTLFICAAACGIAPRAAAQGSNPLRKTDVVRLLSSPVIGKSEIADLIRRNCLAFHPTERDWADLRNLGADAEILGSVGACAGRAKSPEPAPRASLSVVALPERVVAAPEAEAMIRVLVKRGDLVQPGVGLVLRGNTAFDEQGSTEAQAVTDQNGLAQFRLRTARSAETYPLRVALKGGTPSPNDPLVELVVRPAAAAAADVLPHRLSLDSADVGSVTIAVIVKDAFGNPVPDQAVELSGADPEMGVATVATQTDSIGRAAFVLEPRTIRRAGRIDVRAHGTRLASLEAVYTDAVSSAESRFVTGNEQVGIARTQLNAPLVFQARASSGRPLAGRIISFTAHNAEVTPDHAGTDGAGLVQVQVTLGTKAGTAVVIASVDTVQAQATFRVQPADADAVIIEQNRVRVDGGHIVVTAGTPFSLTISARDAYGNAVPVAGLARVLEQMRARFNAGSSLLRMESVQSDYWVTTVTFRALARGSAPLTLADATVGVEVVGRAGLAR